MNIEKRREELYAQVMDALEKEPVTLTYSSPKIKRARIIFVSKEPIDNPETLKEVKDQDLTLSGILFGDPGNYTSKPPEGEPEEELTEKEKRKLEKAKEKETKREEKAFQKMRKDVKKRGFETGVLYELNDPADIYSMSDEEITQVEFASIINGDGFYNFQYPDDHEDMKNDSRGRRKATMFIIGFAVVVIALMVIFINNLMSIL